MMGIRKLPHIPLPAPKITRTTTIKTIERIELTEEQVKRILLDHFQWPHGSVEFLPYDNVDEIVITREEQTSTEN